MFSFLKNEARIKKLEDRVDRLEAAVKRLTKKKVVKKT